MKRSISSWMRCWCQSSLNRHISVNETIKTLQFTRRKMLFRMFLVRELKRAKNLADIKTGKIILNSFMDSHAHTITRHLRWRWQQLAYDVRARQRVLLVYCSFAMQKNLISFAHISSLCFVHLDWRWLVHWRVQSVVFSRTKRFGSFWLFCSAGLSCVIRFAQTATQSHSIGCRRTIERLRQLLLFTHTQLCSGILFVCVRCLCFAFELGLRE